MPIQTIFKIVKIVWSAVQFFAYNSLVFPPSTTLWSQDESRWDMRLELFASVSRGAAAAGKSNTVAQNASQALILGRQ